MKILNDKQLKISAKALGGTLRRSVRLDIENGRTLNYLPFFIT